MPLRSRPVEIVPITNRSGTTSYRVTGTLRPGGKQQKRVFKDVEDAQAQQSLWESQRILGAAAVRPKITSLTQQQLRVAEACFLMAERTGRPLLDIVQDACAAPPPTPVVSTTFGEGLDGFLKEAGVQVSTAQCDSYRQRALRFGEFIGMDRKIDSVTEKMMLDWLDSHRSQDGGPIKKKTWNNLFGDVSAVFAFFLRKGWISKHPFKGLKRYSKRALGAGARKRLTVAQARDLMAYVEQEQPKWACYFAITLFAGVRPDLRNGEMAELSRCVKRDGPEVYFANGKLHLSAEITKEGQARRTTISANLAAWLEKFPPTPENLRPGDPKECSPIRKLHQLPHDGLRHTCISAYMSNGANYDQAADEFGNSEPIIKRHYLDRMPPEEAAAFFQIMPTGTHSGQPA